MPNFSILKHALAFCARLRYSLICSNKTWEDVIFREQLTALERRHPERLRVVHTLTREAAPDRGTDVRSGRISAPLLRELVPDPSACLASVCGPAISTFDRAAAREAGMEPAPRFMESALEALREVGVPADRIKRESYG